MFNGFVAKLIIYLIGFVLLGFGIFQIIALVSANRVLKVGMWSFIMPSLVAISGGFLLFNPDFAEASMSLLSTLLSERCMTRDLPKVRSSPVC